MNENNSQEAEIEIPFRSNKRRKMIIIDEDDTKEEKQQDEKKNTEKEKKDCGICLEVVTIRGKMDGCDHSFCFPCIHQWSQVTNLCPLCKQEFKQLIKIDLNSISNSSPKKSDIIYVKKRKQRVPDEELPEGIIYYDSEFDGENVDEYEEDGFVLFSDEEEDGDLDADFYEEEEEIDAEFMKDMIDSSCSDSEDEIPVNIPQRRNSTARRGNISTRSSRNNNSSATRNRNRRSNNSNNTINNTTNNNNININTNNNNNNNNNNGRNLNRKEMTEEAFNGVIDLITPPNSRGGFYVSTISSLNPGLIPPFPSFTNSINLISRDRISISSSSQSSSNGNNSNLINLISESPDSSFKKNNVNKVSNEVEESPLKISSTRARKFVYNDSSDDESKPSDKAWKDFDKILKQNEKENEKNRTTDSSPAWIRKKRNK